MQPYNIPSDILEYTATDHSNERLHGNLLNKAIYGLLSEEEQRRLFTDPSQCAPIIYACRDEHVKIELLLRNMDMYLPVETTVSQAAYSTRFGQAMLVSVLQNLSDGSVMRRFERLLLEKTAKIPFEDGLSPIFTLNKTAEFEQFVDKLDDRQFLLPWQLTRTMPYFNGSTTSLS